LVMWLGMRRLSRMAVIGLSLWSGGFLILMTQSLGGMPSLLIFMIWLLAAFFCIGIMFGNLMALAMEPLGDFAGLGSAFVGALSTMISLPLGWMISDAYDGTVYALVTGFTVLAIAAWLVMVWTDWGHEVKPS